MGRHAAWPVVALALAASSLSCSGSSVEEGALRARAEAFGELMVELRDLSETRARERVTGFLEPSPQRSDRVDAYLAESRASSGKFRVVSSAVESVQLYEDASEAFVVFSMVARGPNGSEIPARQQTHWRVVDGEWYRTARDPEKRLGG